MNPKSLIYTILGMLLKLVTGRVNEDTLLAEGRWWIEAMSGHLDRVAYKKHTPVPF